MISGRLYIDLDGSRSLTDADEGIQGSVVSVEQVDDAGNHIAGQGVVSDARGFWERRALPDGRYRVSWEPPLPPAEFDTAIPPAEAVVLNPNLTVQRVVRVVEIRGESRLSDVNFGIPKPVPSFGGVTLPDTGRGASGSGSGVWLTVSALLASLVAAGMISLLRRA